MKIGSLTFAVAALFALTGQSSAQTMTGSPGSFLSGSGAERTMVQPQIGHPLARHGRQAAETTPGSTKLPPRPPKLPPIIDDGGTRSPYRPLTPQGPDYLPSPPTFGPVIGEGSTRSPIRHITPHPYGPNYAPAPPPVPKYWPSPYADPVK